jgi:hypothetical protein
MVFKNRMLRRIFGPNRGEVTGEQRKLQTGELRNLSSSLNIIRQIESRRVRWAGHVARVGDDRKVYKVFMEILKEGDYSEGQGVDGRMASKWIGWELAGWMHLAHYRDRRGSFEQGDEPSAFWRHGVT